MAQEESLPDPRAPRAPSRGRVRLGLLVALPLAALVALAVWRHYAVRESTDDAQIDGHIHSVAARVGGTVQAVKAEDNRLVEAGALLVQIDPRDCEVALQRARADLAEALGTARAAHTGVPVTSTTTASQLQGAAGQLASARARLDSARARRRESEARRRKAAQDLERVNRLVAKDEVSQQEHDAVALAAEAAQAELAGAEAAVEEAQQDVAVAEARLSEAGTGPQQVAIVRARADSAQARVEQAQAALEQAQLDLDHTAVRAPVRGVVSKRSVEPGQVVQAGQPLLALVPLEDVWVTANFKENQLRAMRPGQPVTIAVDAYGGRTYRGRVDSLSPATGARFSLLPAENASGNFVKVVQRVPVKIVFEPGQDPEHRLRPGMSVVPTVLTR